MTDEKRKPYLQQLLSFFFAPIWPSFFTIFYLLFFSYFALFYIGHIIIAIKFLIYTIRHSTQLLGLGYLFWGAAFMISLVVPFAVSLYAIFLAHEIWKGVWEERQKWMSLIFVVLAVPLIVVL